MGAVAIGRLGVGYIQLPSWGKAKPRERRELVQSDIRHMVEGKEDHMGGHVVNGDLQNKMPPQQHL